MVSMMFENFDLSNRSLRWAWNFRESTMHIASPLVSNGFRPWTLWLGLLTKHLLYIGYVMSYSGDAEIIVFPFSKTLIANTKFAS